MGLFSFGKKKEETAPQVRQEATDTEGKSIQACLETLYELREQMENGKEADEAQIRSLQEAVLEKVRKAPALYVLQDESTGLPFLTDRTAEVYSERALAEQAVAFYAGQHRALFVKEVPRERTGLPCRVALFSWFWYLGVGSVILDNGASSLTLPLQRFCEPPKLPDDSVPMPVVNPALRSSMIDFLEETRWHVEYEGRQEALEEKESELNEDLKKARFLVPVNQKAAALKEGVTSIAPEDTGKLALPRVENGRQQSFLPLFTDWLEFQGAYDRREWGLVVLSLREAVAAAGEDGIVINPLTENLILEAEHLKKWRKEAAEDSEEEK